MHSYSAAEFIKAVNGVEINKLTADEQKVFQLLQPKIVSDSKLINGTKDINRQRDAFASLSNSMISLAKNARLSNKEVYLDYCPMKKSYWLSAEQSVKNPYYGSTMLTCGTVKETIKQ